MVNSSLTALAMSKSRFLTLLFSFAGLSGCVADMEKNYDIKAFSLDGERASLLFSRSIMTYVATPSNIHGESHEASKDVRQIEFNLNQNHSMVRLDDSKIAKGRFFSSIDLSADIVDGRYSFNGVPSNVTADCEQGDARFHAILFSEGLFHCGKIINWKKGVEIKRVAREGAQRQYFLMQSNALGLAQLDNENRALSIFQFDENIEPKFFGKTQFDCEKCGLRLLHDSAYLFGAGAYFIATKNDSKNEIIRYCNENSCRAVGASEDLSTVVVSGIPAQVCELKRKNRRESVVRAECRPF
jgi:hypothetical protein